MHIRQQWRREKTEKLWSEPTKKKLKRETGRSNELKSALRQRKNKRKVKTKGQWISYFSFYFFSAKKEPGNEWYANVTIIVKRATTNGRCSVSIFLWLMRNKRIQWSGEKQTIHRERNNRKLYEQWKRIIFVYCSIERNDRERKEWMDKCGCMCY